jgi:hypothetical protein
MRLTPTTPHVRLRLGPRLGRLALLLAAGGAGIGASLLFHSATTSEHPLPPPALTEPRPLPAVEAAVRPARRATMRAEPPPGTRTRTALPPKQAAPAAAAPAAAPAAAAPAAAPAPERQPVRPLERAAGTPRPAPPVEEPPAPIELPAQTTVAPPIELPPAGTGAALPDGGG